MKRAAPANAVTSEDAGPFLNWTRGAVFGSLVGILVFGASPLDKIV